MICLILLNQLTYVILQTIQPYACDRDVNSLINRLEHDSYLAIEWFENNSMKLNQDKCHFFWTCSIFPMFFANDYLKNFDLEVLGFLSPKLSKIDHFTVVKSSICWCFGQCSCLNQVKSPFSA